MEVKIGDYEIKTATRLQIMKRTNQVKLFPKRREGKDSWSIYNEIKTLAGEDFNKRVFVSPCGDYALISVAK